MISLSGGLKLANGCQLSYDPDMIPSDFIHFVVKVKIPMEENYFEGVDKVKEACIMFLKLFPETSLILLHEH